MRNIDLCIKRYIEDGHLNNIALRIGKGNYVLADIYESTEKNITDSTLFDMASVTKVMVTSMLCLIAIDKKKIALEDSVSKFFDVEDEKQKIKIKDLLVHTIGIGHKSLLFEGCNYDNVQNFVLSIPSDVPIGSETLYSCPGYILLGKILENVFGKRLDELFYEYIAEPLGMKRTSFHPDNKNQFVNSNLLPGEIGMVNDYNCRFLGGVAGNAGLFSCVEDVRHLTNIPIKFIGISEKMDGLTEFHPDRMANRIIGMGDVLSLVEKVESEIDEKEALKAAKKMTKGTFDLEDFLAQLNQIKKLGPLENLIKLIPGAKKMGLADAKIDPKQMAHIEAIVLSMTPEERHNPDIIKASRKQRIAKGCGLTVTDVNKLLTQFEEMKKMMKMLGNNKNFKLPF